MKCIYCREDRGDFSTREHFIPERLGYGHPFVLEKEQQAVCDKCQGWASRKVDPAIAEQLGAIAQFLHVFQIPGKSGRPTRIRNDSGVEYDPVGGKMSIEPAERHETAPAGDDLLLCRGVHKMALGAVAWARSVEDARSPSLDVIGFPLANRQTSFRPFARAHGRWIDEQVGLAVRVDGVGDDLLVSIQLYIVTVWATLGAAGVDGLRGLHTTPGVLVQWKPGDAPECLGRPTMAVTGLQNDGTTMVAIKPAPERDQDGWIAPAAFVASVLAPTIQEIPSCGRAW